MNKSKFLKKSLAALLAVMLVVAMIPLSAAASADALPALTRIYVNDTEITANGTEFSANFAEDQAEGTIEVKATLPADTKLEAFTSKESLTGTEIDDTGANLDVKDYTGGGTEGVVYLKLSDASSPSLGRESVWYTLNLKQVNLDDASGVKGVTVGIAGKNNGLLNATVDQENLTINVEAAYGYTATTITDGLTIIPTDGASVVGSADNTVDVIKNGQFSIVAGGINTVWTIKITEVEALLDFTVAGKQGTIDHDAKTITVNLTMDDIKDQYGDLLGDNPQLVIDYSTITNTAVAIHTASSTTFADGTAFTSGSKQTLTGLGTAALKSEKYILVRNGSASNAQPYKLTVQIPKNTDTTISYAAIGGVEATIDGTNISAVLSNSPLVTGAQDIRLHVPVGATISGVTVAKDSTESTSEYDVYKGTGQTSATPGEKKTIVVTAADNSYSTQYSIWYTVADGQTEAALKSLNLKDGDNIYTGTVDESAKSVTIEVPYMTTTMAGWKIFATYSAGAIGTYNSAPIMSGITPIVNTTPGTTDLPAGITNGDTKTLTNFITVNSQGTTAVETKYALVVKFKKPNNNKLLTGLKVTVQNNNPALSDQKLVRGMTDKNTYNAVITAPEFNSAGVVSKLGKIEIETAHSQRKAVTDMVMAISEVTTNGGVPYIGFTSSGGTNLQVMRIDALDPNKTTDFTSVATKPFSDFYKPSSNQWATELDDTTTSGSVSYYVVVLPEEVAKRYDSDVKTKGIATLASTDYQYRSLYQVELKSKAANTQGKLNSLTIAGQTMRVTTGSDGQGTIIGTLPYSATRGALNTAPDQDTVDGKKNIDNAQFVEFNASDYAVLGETAPSYTDNTTKLFASSGDTNGDGEANDPGTKNAKILFVRGDDHNVDAYVITAGTLDTNLVAKTTGISVYSENAVGNASAPTNTYKFQLKYADACKEADITSFDLSGNKGSISGKTINVSVPKGTNLKALRATFETSIGAKVYLDEAKTEEIKSGKTVLNCSSDVKLYVLSEDGSKTEVYTVKVTEGEMFVDVNKSDWFYDEVNTAANNGWINGTGDGYFTPYGSMTRGQFALIIARMEVKDFDEETEVDCPFPDVEGAAYRAAAKYVYDQGYMQGDGDNFFNATDNITRAQAAIVLCKMKGIEPMSGNTDYDDDASIADWAKGYVKAATAAGIFKGEGDDFNPQRELRRCEGAAILVRSANK